MAEDVSDLTTRDYASAAIVNVHMARQELTYGNLARADQFLLTSEQLLLKSGAKDIGQLDEARTDLPDRVFEQIGELESRIEEAERRLDEEDNCKVAAPTNKTTDAEVKEAVEDDDKTIQERIRENLGI